MNLSPATALAATATTPIGLLLLSLVALNAVALARPWSLLSRLVGTALLVPLLLPLGLPIREPLLANLLSLTIPLLAVVLLSALLRIPEPHREEGEDRRRWPFLAMALGASLAMGLLFALRPNPFEYPGDSTNYLQGFIEFHLERPGPISCLVQGWRQPTYQSVCTLWGVLVRVGHLDSATLVGGIPQRFTLLLEVCVLGLSYFRLLQRAGIGPPAAALAWLLLCFGLGNQAISFLVNNGLQGSILAAAIFLEAVMLLLHLLRRPPPGPWGTLALVASPLAFTYLELKLHGAFALMCLLLLLPLLGLVGAARLWGHCRGEVDPLASLPRPTARQLLWACLLILALVLTFRTGWVPDKEARTIVRWSFLAPLGWPTGALPASYLLRSPGSRPEILAVAALLTGFLHLASLWRPGPGPRSGAGREGEEADLYGLLASLYGLAVLLAFLLPPLSHLYINLPYEIISNYRLMWGCILFSPLPCLLDRACRGPAPRWPAALAGTVVAALVLIPVPSGSRTYPQRFWSKSEHILRGPSPRVDLLRVAAALLPTIQQARPPGSPGPVVVLADELIGSALAPYAPLVLPIHPTRVDHPADLTNWETHGLLRRATGDGERLRVIQELKTPPALVIQQAAIPRYYSPYAEINVYDKEIMALVSGSGVNRLSPAVLRAAGFHPWRWLDGKGQPLGQGEAAVVYQVWARHSPEATPYDAAHQDQAAASGSP